MLAQSVALEHGSSGEDWSFVAGLIIFIAVIGIPLWFALAVEKVKELRDRFSSEE